MRFARYQIEQTEGLAIETGGAARGLMETDRGYPGDLDVLVRKGPPALDKAAKALGAGHPIDLARISRLPPLRAPEKVICVGLNYREHSAESGFKQPDYPTLFSRFNSRHRRVRSCPRHRRRVTSRLQGSALADAPKRRVAQSASISDMVFDVATLIAIITRGHHTAKRRCHRDGYAIGRRPVT